jgi:DNA-binding GntR family transcriptional regulator
LTGDSLSRQLGISKSPVREALNSLSTEGLVRIEARRGAYLRRFSRKEVADLYSVCEALEVCAVGMSQLTPQLFMDLQRGIRRTEKLLRSKNKQGHIDEDTHFHALIAEATGNGFCRTSRAKSGCAEEKRTIFRPPRRPTHTAQFFPRSNGMTGRLRRLPCIVTSRLCAKDYSPLWTA